MWVKTALLQTVQGRPDNESWIVATGNISITNATSLSRCKNKATISHWRNAISFYAKPFDRFDVDKIIRFSNGTASDINN
jgi:hypothetical protein